MWRDPRFFAVVLAIGGGVGVLASPAEAQCTYPTLTSGTAGTVSATPQPYTINQTDNFYTAVGVRPAAGSDWNVAVYQSQAAFPACVATSLGSSTRTSGVDFVIGDFNSTHDPLGLYYPQVTRASAAGSATVEWDSGPNSLIVNAPLVSRSTGPTDVLEVWDVSLSAGNTYTFTFNQAGTSLKLLLFKSGAGVYWAGRDSKLFEANGTTIFTPATSGFYGVVVVNDDGTAGTYTLGVGRCDVPTALTSGVTSTSTKAEQYWSFNQTTDFFWTAVGIRGTANWNLEVYGSQTGGTFPACFGSLLASSAQAAPATDFVVGNFNVADLVAPYYVHAYMNQDIGSGSSTIEWDDGGTINDFIDPDGPPPTPTINRTTGANDVLECWDVYLTQGNTYQFFFSTSGAALKLFLFPSTLAWGSRSDAILTLTGSSTASPFVAPATGFYGLVVVNEDGATGSYALRVYSPGVVAIGDAPPAETRLEGLEPNPTRGAARVRFALREPGSVGFEVIDAAGRRVADVPERAWSAGRWSVAWDGRGRSGERLPPGVYFLRMTVGGRPAALRKFALLE